MGLKTTLRTLLYALRRDGLDRRYTLRSHPGAPELPGPLLEACPEERGGRFRFQHTTLSIEFLAPDLARIDWEPGRPPIPYALDAFEWPPVSVRLDRAPGSWALHSAALEIQIQPDGGLRFRDPAGNSLHWALPPLRAPMGGGEFAWIARSSLAPDERLFGLGEQTTRSDLRGRTYRLWNSDPGGSYGPAEQSLYAQLPVYLGLHAAGSYLIFHENSHPSVFRFPGRELETEAASRPAVVEARFEGGRLRYYFIPGPPDHALRRYTQLTGRAGLPPLWSLGYHQSRWGYRSEADVRAVAAGFREHQMPVSAIHLDIDYMDEYRVFTVDRFRFPDLPRLAADLRDQGIRLVTIVDPGVKVDPDYEIYRDGLARDMFCKGQDGLPFVGLVWPGWTVFPDFTRAETRAWWGKLYKRLLEAGIDGIWHDMNEPACFAAWGDLSLPLATQHDLEGLGGGHREAHNLYGLQMNRAGHEALKTERPESRPWIVSRSGWAGGQRYAWNWTGDTESTWAGLRMTIPTVLGMGLSGLAFTGPDIGGFSGNPPAELYLRSFQMAAFLPFFRTHSATGTLRREPWVFGEPYTGILRRFLELRYRLLPYLYSLAWENTQTGWPLIRPLFWHEVENPDLWDVDDAFLLGEALLVAPILEESAGWREVFLPTGTWYSLWNGGCFSGPGKVRLETDLETIPVLVRGGSVLPMRGKPGQLILHVYPPEKDHSGAPLRLYSDAGDGYGRGRVDQIRAAWSSTGLELTWGAEGKFPFPYSEVQVSLHGPVSPRASIDGLEIKLEENTLKIEPFRSLRFEC